MPRGGGKGGTLLRAHSFKLRHELEALFFTDQFCRTRGTGGVQRDNPYKDLPACGNRQMHKAEGPRSGTVATAADCAFIAYLRAWTKATLRACKYMQTVCERMERNEVQRNE